MDIDTWPFAKRKNRPARERERRGARIIDCLQFRLIRWSTDDSFVLTVDASNVISQWNPYTGQRISQVDHGVSHAVKILFVQFDVGQFNIDDLIICQGNKFAYLLCSDGMIREFQLMSVGAFHGGTFDR